MKILISILVWGIALAIFCMMFNNENRKDK